MLITSCDHLRDLFLNCVYLKNLSETPDSPAVGSARLGLPGTNNLATEDAVVSLQGVITADHQQGAVSPSSINLYLSKNFNSPTTWHINTKQQTHELSNTMSSEYITNHFTPWIYHETMYYCVLYCIIKYVWLCITGFKYIYCIIMYYKITLLMYYNVLWDSTTYVL